MALSESQIADLNKRVSAARQKKADLASVQGLESFARSKGQEPPKENKIISGLKTVGRVLNIGTAITAGATRGIISPTKTITQGIAEGVQKNLGFGDVIREDLGIKPKTRVGKIAVGTVSLAADILFDPLTYVSFGESSALKIGGRTLSKEGVTLFSKAAREAGGKVGLANELFMRAVGKKGLTEEAMVAARKVGVGEDTLQSLARMHSRLLDQGGIKFAGKSLISSKALGNIPILSPAVKSITNSTKVKALRDAAGSLFVYNFGKNPIVQGILEKGKIVQEGAEAGIAKGFIPKLSKVFSPLNEKELEEFVTKAHRSRLDVIDLITKEQKFDRGLPGEVISRRIAKETQRGTRLVSDNPKVQAAFDSMFGNGKEKGMVSEFSKMAGLDPKDAFEFYFPIIQKAGKEEVGLGLKGLGSPKLNFLKEFTGKTEDFIRNPIEAFGKRYTGIVRSRIQGDVIQKFVNTMGREFVSDAEAHASGYLSFTRNTINGPVKTFLPENVVKELNDFISPSIKPVDAIAKASGFDWYQGLMKGYLTSLFPGFHIRNLASNQYLNMQKFGMSALNPKTNALAGVMIANRDLPGHVANKLLSKSIMTKTGKEYSLREVLKLAEQQGTLGRGAFGAVEQGIETAKALRGKVGKLRRIAGVLGPQGELLGAGRKVGTAIEDHAKLVGFMTSLIEGKSPAQAAKDVEQALFNYAHLTTTEKSIFRRIIPFYTFARKNAEEQVRALFTTPGRVGMQFKAIRGIERAVGEPTTPEEEALLPTWVKDSFGIKTGTDANGNPIYITGFGLPIEEFLSFFGGQDSLPKSIFAEAMNRMSPVFKYPIEKVTGQDIYQGRPIQEIYNAGQFVDILNVMPGPVADQMKKFLDWKEVDKPIFKNNKVVGTQKGYVADPNKLHFLRNLPTSRLFSTVGSATNEAVPIRLRALKTLTGVRVAPIDMEQQKFFSELNREKELTAWLKRVGLIGIMTKPFVPKETPQKAIP